MSDYFVPTTIKMTQHTHTDMSDYIILLPSVDCRRLVTAELAARQTALLVKKKAYEPFRFQRLNKHFCHKGFPHIAVMTWGENG